MLKINSAPIQHRPPQLNQNANQANTAQAQPHGSAEQAAAAVGVRTVGELEMMATDLAALASQMRRRSAAEKRSSRSTDPFARMAQEEAEGKVDSLTTIAKASDISKSGFLDLARSMFPDDSDLVLVLRELIRRRRIRKAGSIETLQLEEILEQVWNETDTKQTKAGVNVGLKATLFSRTMKVSAKALRQSYRDFISSDDGVLPQYEVWVQQFGDSRRGQIAEYMESAILVDIQSHDPSCSKLEFGALLGQLLTLKKLQASDMAFLQVFLRSSPNYVLLEPRLLQTWFDCLQRPFKIKKEIDQHAMANLAGSLMLPVDQVRQKLLMAIREIDNDLFMDEEIRQVLIDTLLEFDPGRPIIKSPG